MKEKKITAVRVGVLLLAALFFAVLHWILREKVPERQEYRSYIKRRSSLQSL